MPLLTQLRGTLVHHTHTHTHIHKKQKSKASRCLLQVTRSWTSQSTCALSRYDVPVLCALLEPGQGTRRRYQPCLPLPVWAPCSPTTTISGTMRPSRCALLPQYKTRYPFYRWVGWSTCDVFRCSFFSSCPGIRW